jgi:hypothetical protein
MFQVFHPPSEYVASAVSECFKSRSGVASPSLPAATSSWCLLLLLTPARHPPPPSPSSRCWWLSGRRGPRVVAWNGARKGL